MKKINSTRYRALHVSLTTIESINAVLKMADNFDVFIVDDNNRSDFVKTLSTGMKFFIEYPSDNEFEFKEQIDAFDIIDCYGFELDDERKKFFIKEKRKCVAILHEILFMCKQVSMIFEQS